MEENKKEGEDKEENPPQLPPVESMYKSLENFPSFDSQPDLSAQQQQQQSGSSSFSSSLKVESEERARVEQGNTMQKLVEDKEKREKEREDKGR